METTKLLDSTTLHATEARLSSGGTKPSWSTTKQKETECVNNHLFELLKKAHVLNTIEKDNIRRVTEAASITASTPVMSNNTNNQKRNTDTSSNSTKKKAISSDRVLIDILGERNVDVSDVSFDLETYHTQKNNNVDSVNINTKKQDQKSISRNGTTKADVSNMSANTSENSKRDIKQYSVSIASFAECLRNVVSEKMYMDQNSLLFSLNFNVTENFLVISTNEINENLRHIDPHLDRVLHQTKFSVFEMPSCMPVCYLEKTIKESDLTYLKPHNSYLKSHVYDVVKDYHTKEFHKSVVSVYKHHIGSYIVMFYGKDRWYFVLHNNVHEFNSNNHPILYEHVGKHVQKFDKNLCYHTVLVDSRIRRLITPSSDTNYVVLVKLTEKYTLREFALPLSILSSIATSTNTVHSVVHGGANTAPSNTANASFAAIASGHNGNVSHLARDIQTSDLIHDVFVKDKRIYVSCLDELQVRLEELDITNSKSKRLVNRGYIAKIRVDDLEPVNIAYDTQTYKRLMSVVPVGMSIHEVHLRLYQQDKLNYFLQYVTDSFADVVKRINTSMSTMSREILDIYHMTRKKKNSELYNMLPQSYRQILYQLHSDYIAQKNKRELPDTASWRLKLDGKIESKTDDVNIDFEDCKFDRFELDGSSSDSNDDKGSGDNDGKVSISVDNVYTKLKDLDMYSLVELYKDRDELIKNIESSNLLEVDDDQSPVGHTTHTGGSSAMTNPIKACTNTKIQSKLLSMKTPI